MTSFYLYYIVIRRNSEKTVFISTKRSFMTSKRDIRTSSSEGVIGGARSLMARYETSPILWSGILEFIFVTLIQYSTCSVVFNFLKIQNLPSLTTLYIRKGTINNMYKELWNVKMMQCYPKGLPKLDNYSGPIHSMFVQPKHNHECWTWCFKVQACW